MKMKRLVATMLALLLVVSLLPMTALAANDNYDELETNTGEIDVNAGPITNNGTPGGGLTSGTVKVNVSQITNNYGTVQSNKPLDESHSPTISNNYGFVQENKAVVTNNKSTGEVTINNGTVNTNVGLVGINNNNVNTNSGTVTTNKGEVTTNGTKGTVTTNEKDVTYNKGKVGTNAGTGTVDKNWGNITTNNGTVNKNETIIKNGVEFKGVIENNNGTVKTNGEGGTVVTNAAKGTIEVNDGTVYTNNGKVEDNSGEVLKNFATVETNQSNCVVGKVNEYDPETGNYSISYTGGNFGTITTNEGIVSQNGGYLFLPDVNKSYEHSGTIETNAQSGTVLENSQWGTIGANFGTVITNNGTVTNKAGGEVLDNYGIVENEKGGILNDMILSENLDNEEEPYACEYNQFTGEEGTYVGTWVDRGNIETEDGGTENFEAGGIVTVLKQAIQGTKLNLKEVGKLFKKDGYKVIGYRTDFAAELAQNEDAADSDVVYETEYEVTEADGWLSLIWGKIKAVVKPSGSAEDPAPKPSNIPTSLSAGQVKVGAYVRRGNMTFVIIEVTDNDIRVATAGKLSEQDLADMMGCLKKHLSDAQIAKLIGEPELLEQELVNFFFGGRNEHIAFRAARDLFA